MLIIGGRYGSEATKEKIEGERNFYSRYDSITKLEYKEAIKRDIPVYILIDAAVYAEYQTFQRNENVEGINYAHVDSANIFHLIREIIEQRRNNAFHQFSRFSEIEAWLREQWAGLFRDFLSKRSSQNQIASLAAQVTQLAEVSKTLRRYLEEVVSKVVPDQSAGIIEDEHARLEAARQEAELATNELVTVMRQFFCACLAPSCRKP